MHITSYLLRKVMNSNFSAQVWLHVDGIPNFIGWHLLAAGRIRTKRGLVCNYDACVFY